MVDHRRHTVDFSNWTSMGLTYEHFAPVHQSQQQQQQQVPSSAAGHRESQDQVQSPHHGSTPSNWDKHGPGSAQSNLQHHSSSLISASSSNLCGEIQTSRTHLHLPPQHPGHPRPGNSHLLSTGNALNDTFGRRASMSHLPLCSFSGGGGGDRNSSWDQSTVLPGTLYDTVSFPVPQASSLAWDLTATTGDRGVPDEDRDSSFATFYDSTSYENDGEASQRFSSQQQPPHPPPSFTSSRRSSRVLPNPIQPPMTLKMNTDDHSLQGRDDGYGRFDPSPLDQNAQKHRPPSQRPFSASTSTSTTSFSDMGRSEEDDTTITASSSLTSLSTVSSQGTVQHGGFVPGFDLWMSSSGSEKSKKVMPSSSSFSGLSLMGQQRRNSESVLQDFAPSTDLDYLSLASIYRLSSNSSIGAAPSAVTVAVAASVSSQASASSASTRSTSPLDGFGGGGSSGGLNHPHPQAGPPTFPHDLRDGQEMRRDHSLSSLEEELDYRSAGMVGQGSGDGRQLSSLHPHFAAVSGNESNVDLTGYMMCGLCGVQPSTVPLGACGHRICNVCHQHEKHRSMRLFQNAIPPCPFCAHGIGPTDNNPSVGPHLSRSYLIPGNVDLSHKQQRHLSLPPPARQQHQRLSSPLSSTQNRRGSESFLQEEFVDGTYHYGRQYAPTFLAHGASYGTSSAPTVERSSSLHLDPSLSAGPSGINSSYTQQRTPPGYFHSSQQLQQRRSSVNQFGAKYQSSTGTAVSTTDRDSMELKEDHRVGNITAGGRQAMTGPPAGFWRDSRAPGVANAIVTMSTITTSLSTPALAEHPYESMRHADAPHPAARRSSIAYDNSRSSTPTVYYNGAGSTPPTNSATILSFPPMPNLPPFVPPSTPRTEAIQWAVIRVTNIPWDVSLQDIQGFLNGFPVPPEHLLSQNVHILMDRATGKTFNSAFVELAVTSQQAGKVAQTRNLKVLKGRLVTVELSSQDELMRSIFPKWIGEFQDGEPLIQGESSENAVSSRPEGGQSTVMPSSATTTTMVPALTPPFVTREEINALLVVCRNYKLHFSRKCAERPFENILSILAKYPWHQHHRVPPLHRDHIFELLKLSIESLRMHLGKEYNTIHPTLLNRMVRCAILTPAFTERQKAMVLHVAGMASCPEDLVGWMAPIVVQTAELSVPTSSAVATTMAKIEREQDMSTTESATDSPVKIMGPESRKLESEIEALDVKESSVSHGDGSSEFPALSSSSDSPTIASKDSNTGGQSVSWAAVAAPCSTTTVPALTIQTGQKALPITPTRSPVTTSSSYAAVVNHPVVSSTATTTSSTAKSGSPTGTKSMKALSTSTPSQRLGMASLLSASSSGSWKPMPHAQHHHHHHNGRSLSLSGFSSFTSSSITAASPAVMPRLPLGAISYAFPSLTSGLQKLAVDQSSVDRKNSSSSQPPSSFPSSASSPTLHHLKEALGGGDGEGKAAMAAVPSKSRLNYRQRSGSLPRLSLPLMMTKATSLTTTSAMSTLSAVPSSPATSIATTTTTTPSFDAWSRSSSLSSSSSISSPGGGFVGLSGLGVMTEGGGEGAVGGGQQLSTSTLLTEMSSRSTSESILDAIKTITQSTPRLMKANSGTNNPALAFSNHHHHSGSKRE
ncbi:hypothetical protein EMPS_00476 [Entomortierella parvispora]|uniref:RING-type domain-containing protein n=1 Tax=Entomortierella parvispora TaxID=205924 RepID=A0A9P3H103_9FUNG|nr:hypothetical protein EMPS_00476 [Entomortierella parvispora]